MYWLDTNKGMNLSQTIYNLLHGFNSARIVQNMRKVFPPLSFKKDSYTLNNASPYSSHTQPISFNQLVGYQFLFSNHIDLQPFCPGKPPWEKKEKRVSDSFHWLNFPNARKGKWSY
ncbi:hypothetical protein ACJW30_08G043200 [Castanea mollissima]